MLKTAAAWLTAVALLAPAAIAAQTPAPSGRPGASARASSPDPDMPRPIDAPDTVFIEDMTWLEVRDAMRAGRKTVIVATGGIEQNGPYLVTGKHNVILRGVTETIARKALTDVAASMKAHGFEHVVLIGDSGGNQAGMKEVAAELRQKRAGGKTRIHFIPEFYDYVGMQNWVRSQGINEVDVIEWRAAATVAAIQKAVSQ